MWDWPGNSCRDESLNEASCLRLTFQEEVEELTVRVLHSLCFYPDSCLSFFILQNPTKVRFVLRSWRRRCESHGLCTVQYIITQRCLNDNVTDVILSSVTTARVRGTSLLQGTACEE